MNESSTPTSLKIWLPLIVFTIAFGGVLAWRVAVPHEPEQSVEPSGVWSSADPSSIARSVNANAAVWQERWDTATATTRAKRVAARWARALPAGGAAPSSGEASAVETAAWAARLPADLTTVGVGAPTLDGAPLAGDVTVPVTVSLTLNQAVDGEQQLAVPMTVTLSPEPGSVDAQTARWQITDVSAARTGLRSLDVPVLVRRTGVDVLAAAADEQRAGVVADEAERSLVEMGTRWRSSVSSVPTELMVFLAPDKAAASKVLGRRGIGSDAQPTGWAYDDGDIVLLSDEIGGQSLGEQRGTVRHEVTHAVTRDLMEVVPTAWLEGIATWEEVELSTAGTDRSIDLLPLLAAFRDGSLGYAELIASREELFGRTTEPDIELGYLASYATIGYLEEKQGHEQVTRALAALHGGEDLDAMLRRVLRTDRKRLGAAVRVWSADQIRKSGRSV